METVLLSFFWKRQTPFAIRVGIDERSCETKREKKEIIRKRQGSKACI
jgi:hypothetical protein